MQSGVILVECFALVGASGTGKSHRAQTVAYEYGIEAIIDDGLLIHEHRIVAGRSAKAESNKMAAVRRAVFMDSDHAQEVRDALFRLRPARILILGTSDHMVERIRRVLDLPKFEQVVRIEEIASPEEIEEALIQRNVQGKHIIPVPTLEVKNRVPVYYVGPLDVLFRRRAQAGEQKIGEKSVVRPSFTPHGRISIEPRAIAQIAQITAQSHTEVARVNRVEAVMENGVRVNLDLTMRYGVALLPLLTKLQQEIKDGMEEQTRLTVWAVNLRVSAVTLR